MANKKAIVLLAEGAEEMETVISADVLVRGGIDVTIAGIAGSSVVKCSRNVLIQPHKALADVANEDFDLVVCPGGLKGAENLSSSAAVGELLKKQADKNGYIAAICAGPLCLMAHKISESCTLTSHPSVADKLKQGGYKYSEDRVVVDGKTVSSRGPGTTFEFGLKLVELLQGKEKADSLVAPMLLKL